MFDLPGSKEKLKSLDQLTDSELDLQFVDQVSEFCRFIFSCSTEKTITVGFTVTGRCKFDGIGLKKETSLLLLGDRGQIFHFYFLH